MTALVVAIGPTLLLARRKGGGWECDWMEQIEDPRCLAADPSSRGRLYCGTDSQGIWRSEDGGRSWCRVGKEIGETRITAVAAGRPDSGGTHGIVYAGTEPSRLYRSEDSGDTWSEMSELGDLPSAGEWSFPPRPHTHHVRWIEPDPVEAGRLHVAIEAGALVRSPDGGRTWWDRVPGSPYDTHTLATHPRADGIVRSAAGDGYFESLDGGDTWQQPQQGLSRRYLVGLAVAPANPGVAVASAAPSPRCAYDGRSADSSLYRRVGDGPWREALAGLPEPIGMTINIPAVHAAEPETFYTANNHGLYRSGNLGESWERLALAWPERLRQERAYALLAVDWG